MIITAKYPSVCACCRQFITVGSKVEWSKGQPRSTRGLRGSVRCKSCGELVRGVERKLRALSAQAPDAKEKP